MGIPIGKLICASNANNVLTDFINTGIYDRNRKFYTTVSPSMDILISSNLERLLYHLTGEDDKLINEWFTALKNDGRYEVNDSVKAAIKENFYAGCCDDEQTKGAIKEVFDEYSYLMDTHTAVLTRYTRITRRRRATTQRRLSLQLPTLTSSALRYMMLWAAKLKVLMSLSLSASLKS